MGSNSSAGVLLNHLSKQNNNKKPKRPKTANQNKKNTPQVNKQKPAKNNPSKKKPFKPQKLKILFSQNFQNGRLSISAAVPELTQSFPKTGAS